MMVERLALRRQPVGPRFHGIDEMLSLDMHGTFVVRSIGKLATMNWIGSPGGMIGSPLA